MAGWVCGRVALSRAKHKNKQFAARKKKQKRTKSNKKKQKRTKPNSLQQAKKNKKEQKVTKINKKKQKRTKSNKKTQNRTKKNEIEQKTQSPQKKKHCHKPRRKKKLQAKHDVIIPRTLWGRASPSASTLFQRPSASSFFRNHMPRQRERFGTLLALWYGFLNGATCKTPGT